MAFAHSIGTQYAVDTVSVVNTPSVVTDAVSDGFDSTIAATSTNVAIPLSFPHGNMSSFLLYSDQDVDLFTNATDGTGGNHFTLKAGIAQTWNKNNGLVNPFTHDVTTFYGNNAGASVANVKIRVLYH